MSPSAPRRGSAAKPFASAPIPWLLMTGTQDVASIGGATLESRLAVFPVLPAGGKYEPVLDGAEHSAFTERAPRNPNHHRVILALATAFWDDWLESPKPRALMEPADSRQSKYTGSTPHAVCYIYLGRGIRSEPQEGARYSTGY